MLYWFLYSQLFQQAEHLSDVCTWKVANITKYAGKAICSKILILVIFDCECPYESLSSSVMQE